MFEAHFQTFEEPEGGVALTARLAAFREELARRKLTGFVIPRADQQQNEYVAAFRRAAGVADRLHRIRRIGHRADPGRPQCSSMAATRCRPPNRSIAKAWNVEPLIDPPPENWLTKHLAAGDRLGFDPWLHTSAAAERLAAACAKAGAELVAVETNPLDSVWTERPPPPLGPVAVHGPQFSGEAETDKLQRIRAGDRKARRRCAGAVGFARGGLDLQHPRRRCLAYAAAAVLCAGAEGRPPHGLHRSPQAFQQRARSSRADRRCRGAGRADAQTYRTGATRRIDRARQRDRRRRPEPPDHRRPAARRCAATIPSRLLKAVKNATEIEGTRTAHRRDAVALARFLAWIDREAPSGALTEIDTVEALESFRRDTGALKDVSFPTIAGTGPNGAIVHYRVTRKTNRRIAPGDLLLIDSGAQYRRRHHRRHPHHRDRRADA